MVASDYYCIDLCPTYPGTLGQVIWVPHDNPARTVLAASLQIFLDELSRCFEMEKYKLDDRYGPIRTAVATFPRSQY